MANEFDEHSVQYANVFNLKGIMDSDVTALVASRMQELMRPSRFAPFLSMMHLSRNGGSSNATSQPINRPLVWETPPSAVYFIFFKQKIQNFK